MLQQDQTSVQSEPPIAEARYRSVMKATKIVVSEDANEPIGSLHARHAIRSTAWQSFGKGFVNFDYENRWPRT